MRGGGERRYRKRNKAHIVSNGAKKKKPSGQTGSTHRGVKLSR